VYRNLVTAGIAREDGGASVSEAVRSGGEEAAGQAEKAADAAEADPGLPPEAKRQLRDTARQVREQAEGAAEPSRALDVPPANLVLFKKHQDEILRYTMGGLELLPL
jgi:hypothetical protein